eukprot:NODE_5235_length_722_cov_3.433878_g4403_i0.p1 GENE.NODE_5235_length_722_cov_3.433878_g4403_i0~~NODE_5235_length_722_cov_3.433878_g4403_i0.p1  ORF type:complete len:164 (+),score=9.04 NODE_5235_length_722_cov_3.433878_g4403_i0:193-684(+)
MEHQGAESCLDGVDTKTLKDFLRVYDLSSKGNKPQLCGRVADLLQLGEDPRVTWKPPNLSGLRKYPDEPTSSPSVDQSSSSLSAPPSNPPAPFRMPGTPGSFPPSPGVSPFSSSPHGMFPPHHPYPSFPHMPPHHMQRRPPPLPHMIPSGPPPSFMGLPPPSR